jgi:toxin ParE1/3/4
MSRFRLSRQADADLDQLADELGQQDPGWAVRVLDGLHATFEFLGTNPLAGAERPDLRPRLRVFPGRAAARSYVVFYYPLEDGVEVATIIHGARDYLGMFGRE